MPRAKAQAAGGSFPDSPHSHLSSRVTRQRAFFIQARTLPHTAAASSHLHRLSVDFAHHPTLLLFEEAEVGERLLSHSSLGSWSTPSLSKLAVSDQVGAMLQGSASTCRAYPTTVEFAHQAFEPEAELPCYAKLIEIISAVSRTHARTHIFKE